MGFFLLKVGPPLEKCSGSAPERHLLQPNLIYVVVKQFHDCQYKLFRISNQSHNIEINPNSNLTLTVNSRFY